MDVLDKCDEVLEAACKVTNAPPVNVDDGAKPKSDAHRLFDAKHEWPMYAIDHDNDVRESY